MNKDKIRDVLDNIDRDLVEKAQNYNVSGSGRRGNSIAVGGSGERWSFLKPLALGFAFVVFIAAGIVAAIVIAGKIKSSPSRAESYQVKEVNGCLQFGNITTTPWYIADADYEIAHPIHTELSDDEIKYVLGHSEEVKRTLFSVLDKKKIIEYDPSSRPLFALEARYSETKTDFDYLFCLYEHHKVVTVKDLNSGTIIGAVSVSDEEVGMITDAVMPELSSIVTSRVFDAASIDHIETSSVFSYLYSSSISAPEDISSLIGAIGSLHVLRTAGEAIQSGAWDLYIYYSDGTAERISLVGNTYVRMSDGSMFSAAFSDISKTGKIIENILLAQSE